MSIRILWLTLSLLLFLPGGCAGPSFKKTSVSEDSGFTPKRVFDLDFPSAWESTLQGLEEKNIPVILRDREKGIIRTDYQAGPDTQYLERVVSSRFKYSIFFFREAEKKTTVNLRCLYEIQRMDGKSFADASGIFPDRVSALEKELYKTIESFLLPREGSPLTSPRTKETQPTTPDRQIPMNPRPMAQVPLKILKEPPSAPSGSTSLASVELTAAKPEQISPPPSTPPKEAQLDSSPPVREVTPIPPKIKPKARVLGYEPIFLITKKNAPLREKPSSQSKIVVTLKKGRKVEKIGESGKWVKVKIWETTIGWTSKDLLQEIR